MLIYHRALRLVGEKYLKDATSARLFGYNAVDHCRAYPLSGIRVLLV